MYRWLSVFVWSLIAAAFVASVASWVRSYWAADWVDWYSSDRTEEHLPWLGFHVETDTGQVALHVGRTWPGYGRDQCQMKGGFQHMSIRPPLGSVWDWSDAIDPKRGVFIQFPHWAFCIPCGLVLGARGVIWACQRRRQSRRAMLGLCVQCGYDLRASADRCPECGLTCRRP